jgi:hypothetical protein
MAIAVLCMLSGISTWIWAVPISCIYLAGTVLIFARGDRITVAEQKKDDSKVLP